MHKGKETILEEKGLKRVNSLEEILNAKVFFIDTVGSNDELRAYPVLRQNGKINLTHGLLNLYGIHWRYLLKLFDWDTLMKENGDLNIVMDDIIAGRKFQRHAAYGFTRKDLDERQSLWLFSPYTPGWAYYQEVLLPRFQADQNEYMAMKRKAHKIREFIKGD